MNLSRALRSLIVCEIAFGLASVFLLPRSRASGLQDLVAAQASRGWVHWLGVIAFALVVAGWIGLWRFWWRARSVYVAGWILGAIVNLFAGPRVISGASNSTGALACLSAGLVLGLVYFTELRHRFERPGRQARPEAA